MAKLRAWLQAARPLAFGNICLPLLYGAALATYARGTALELGGLVCALVWGALDQLCIVFSNDVADEQLDRQQQHPSLVSGGSRVLVENKLSIRSLRRAAAASALALMLLSIGASLQLGAWFLPSCAALALALLWAYSFAPMRLSYINGGAALQAIGMGLVLPTVAWQLQGGELGALFGGTIAGVPSPAWLLPGVLLAWQGNWLTALPDLESDGTGGKATRPVRVGESRVSLESSLLCLLAALGFGALLGFAELLPAWSSEGLVPLALLLLGLTLAHGLRRRGQRVGFVLASLALDSMIWLFATVALWSA